MTQKNWWEDHPIASDVQPDVKSGGSSWWDKYPVVGAEKQEGDGAFLRGLKGAKQSADITTKLATRNASGVAQAVREAELYRRANPGTKEVPARAHFPIS